MCSGYWDKCSCNDCKEVSGLYNRLDSLDRKEELEEVKQIENKIESMGYSV
ncbi:MAG: hypothetical protein ACRCX2_37825 [Paraclostridium sp.]